MEAFAWRATESAHKAYPVFIVRARLTGPGDMTVRVPDNCDANNGWGELGATIISGDHRKPLPLRLEAVWFSYAENRFFNGSVELPLERMQSLFRQPLPPDKLGRPTSFDQLIVGFGLDGHLSVWADGPGFTVEVAAFQVPAADLEWRLVLDNPRVPREDHVRDILTELLAPGDLDRLTRKGVQPQLFDHFRQRHPWTFVTAGPVTPLQIIVRYTNGERETLPVTAVDTPPGSGRPAPLSMIVTWTLDRTRYRASVRLDEGETLAAFDHMAQISGGAAFNLIVEAGELGRTLNLVLAGPQHRYQFERVWSEISAAPF